MARSVTCVALCGCSAAVRFFHHASWSLMLCVLVGAWAEAIWKRAKVGGLCGAWLDISYGSGYPNLAAVVSLVVAS
eukprot:14415301-Alexandrium_andersonii.AAC.1